MACYLCGSSAEPVIIHRGVRGAKNINVQKCTECGLISLDTFINDIDDFYKNSSMRTILIS